MVDEGAGNRNPEQLNEFVAKIDDISQYLGDEVVFIGLGQGDRSGVAMIADVGRSGLKTNCSSSSVGGPGNLVVLDQASLAAAGAEPSAGRGGYALVRDHEVVLADSVATLKKLNAQLDAGPSGFGDSEFGKQIAAAYGRGAGIILGADLHSILQAGMEREAHPRQALANTGLEHLQYLIAEHRETNGSRPIISTCSSRAPAAGRIVAGQSRAHRIAGIREPERVRLPWRRSPKIRPRLPTT